MTLLNDNGDLVFRFPAGPGWVRCPAQDIPVPRGGPAWSVKLHERRVWGLDVEQKYGVRGGILTAPDALTVREAAAEHPCRACNHLIAGGQLYGAALGACYCPCCITADEPQSQFRSGAGL